MDVLIPDTSEQNVDNGYEVRNSLFTSAEVGQTMSVAVLGMVGRGTRGARPSEVRRTSGHRGPRSSAR